MTRYINLKSQYGTETVDQLDLKDFPRVGLTMSLPYT